MALMSESLWLDFIDPSSLGDALDEARADRQLRRAEAQRLAGHVLRHAVDLEHDAAGLDARRPIFRRALTGAHAHFGRLLRDRHVREDADPHPAGALHGARDRAASGLYLARGHALGIDRLQAELTEVEVRAALGQTMNAAFELLTELRFLGLQHSSLSTACRITPPLRARARGGRPSGLLLHSGACPAPSDRVRGS